MKEKYLKLALRVFGVVFLLVYPISIVWPSGWVWHDGEGVYYFQMIVGIYAVLGILVSLENRLANTWSCKWSSFSVFKPSR